MIGRFSGTAEIKAASAKNKGDERAGQQAADQRRQHFVERHLLLDVRFGSFAT